MRTVLQIRQGKNRQTHSDAYPHSMHKHTYKDTYTHTHTATGTSAPLARQRRERAAGAPSRTRTAPARISSLGSTPLPLSRGQQTGVGGTEVTTWLAAEDRTGTKGGLRNQDVMMEWQAIICRREVIEREDDALPEGIPKDLCQEVQREGGHGVW